MMTDDLFSALVFRGVFGSGAAFMTVAGRLVRMDMGWWYTYIWDMASWRGGFGCFCFATLRFLHTNYPICFPPSCFLDYLYSSKRVTVSYTTSPFTTYPVQYEHALHFSPLNGEREIN